MLFRDAVVKPLIDFALVPQLVLQATRRTALLRRYIELQVAEEDRAPLLVALSKELADLGIRPDDAMP